MSVLAFLKDRFLLLALKADGIQRCESGDPPDLLGNDCVCLAGSYLSWEKEIF